MEKNPTIVSFPIKNLDLREFVEVLSLSYLRLIDLCITQLQA